ncbi:MAG: sensor histidine kinase [Pseudomonadota bacterium]|jgi:two-component system sensor histidine kinase QseC|nr:sensor histidine kinase [Xanthomonadaceae bacterium]MDE2247036.1 sensor histidine kinase [Xanthomonadaceae bacterium]MDE3209769.1 sensor histidine kinase [Pseudomonadota bacterium]
MSWLREWALGSIARRLLTFLFGGLGVLMISLFLLLDYGLARQISGRLDDTLLARARGVAVLLEAHPGGKALAELQAFIPEYAGGGHTDFLQIWDDRGHTMLASASNAAANLQPPAAVVPANLPYFYDLRLPDGHRGRGVAMRLALPGSAGDALLVVAEEREQVDLLQRRVHVVLVFGALGTALLAALLSFLAVRGGLRPLIAFGAHAEDEGLMPSEALPAARMPRELRPFADALHLAFQRLHDALGRERRFARDVAHELRTPLAEMRMAVELVQRDSVDSAPLQGAIASIDRMRRCVDGLLSLSRYEAGMDRAQMEPLDVADLLRRALALAAGPAAERDVRMEAVLPPEYWTMSDPALLERIVDNLLLNAVAYAPCHTSVRLSLQRVDGGSCLRIGNDAPELEPADLRRLGERFWRKTPARQSSGHGGLGLALSHVLAQVLGLRLQFQLEHGVLWATLEPLRDITAMAGPVS